MQYNSPPTIDKNHLYNGGIPCADDDAPVPTLSWFAGMLQALGNDADERDRYLLRYEFAVWPVDDPAARTELSTDRAGAGRVNTVQVPDGVLVDGKTYSWQVRVWDGADASNWSKTCSFVVDRTAPSAPAIASSNYPHADTGEWTPAGVPGVFTFSGGGDTDVVGFEYGWEMLGVPGCSYGDLGQLICPDPFSSPSPYILRADAPGGSATVSLSPPRAFRNTLVVRSIDRAGNRSGEVRYEILVPGTSPTVTVVGGQPEWGQQVTLKVTPHPAVATVTEYEYQLDSGATQTVAPAADGTATLTFLADNEYGHQVSVRSHSVNGWVSTAGGWSIYFYPWPGVRSDIYLDNGVPVGGVGVTGTFTFSQPAGWTEVLEYRYRFGDGQQLTVPAGPDGRATITWTPEVSGDVTLEVYAVRPDGRLSDYANWYWFIVA